MISRLRFRSQPHADNKRGRSGDGGLAGMRVTRSPPRYERGELRSMEIATKAGVFLAACSKVGLIALIDEATGYQYVRSEEAMQLKLRLFLGEAMREWEQTFPEELWREFGRLTNWQGSLVQRPKYWGRLVMELIYEYLEPDVADWLRKHNPRTAIAVLLNTR